MLLHGSNRSDIEEFQPREQTSYHAQPTGAVFATPDPIWAMFFAVTDTAHVVSRWNACLVPEVSGLPRTRYFFSVGCRPADAWTIGAVYLLPRDNFTVSDEPSEWTNSRSVRPLAVLEVEPADFLFKDRVFRHRPGEADWIRLARLAGNGPLRPRVRLIERISDRSRLAR